MDLDTCISELRLNSQKEYEEYVPVLEKYRDILASEIVTDPKNIRAASLLAMVHFQLRESTEVSIKCLKHAYRSNQHELADKEFAMLATNSAYFYIREYRYTGKAVCNLLKKAIQANSPFAETYFALALLYYKNEQYREALPFFKKACDLSNQFGYQYDYAYCLFKCEYAGRAIGILKGLSINWRYDSESAKAYYLSGIIFAFQDKIEDAREIAMDLFSVDYCALDVDEFDLAKLMFLIGDYERCIKLYEKANFSETADWLGEYFYSLKALNQGDQAKEKFYDTIQKIEEDIADKQNEASQWEQKELESYISGVSLTKSEIQECYRDAFVNNLRPKVLLLIPLIDECYYIECPMHYFNNHHISIKFGEWT
jgi:tetratricopeptide (TPR) repeat protein